MYPNSLIIILTLFNLLVSSAPISHSIISTSITRSSNDKSTLTAHHCLTLKVLDVDTSRKSLPVPILDSNHVITHLPLISDSPFISSTTEAALQLSRSKSTRERKTESTKYRLLNLGSLRKPWLVIKGKVIEWLYTVL